MIETNKVRWWIELDIICDKCWKWDSYDWDDFQWCMIQSKADWRKTTNKWWMRIHLCPDCITLD